MAVVEEALKLTSIPKFDLESLRRELELLVARQPTLFGIETQLKNAMEARVRNIQSDVEAAKLMQQCSVPIVELDPVVLSWRHGKTIKGVRVPSLAPVGITNPLTLFRQRIQHQASFSPTLFGPDIPTDRYADVFTSLANVGFREGYRELRFTFEGAIPNDARDLIHKARPYFQSFFLLVDAPLESWTVEKRAKTIRERARDWRVLDPIIVGMRGGRLWVVGSFDVTPVEQYVLEEFTVNQLGPGT